MANSKSSGGPHPTKSLLFKGVVRPRRFRSGQCRQEDLNQESFDRWCATFPHLASNTLLDRQRIVRRFCLHRRRKEPGCLYPPPCTSLDLSRSSALSS
jgi:hypothetical protein